MYRTTVPGIFRDQEHEIYRFDDSNDFKYDELEDHMLSKFALWQGHVSLSGRIEEVAADHALAGFENRWRKAQSRSPTPDEDVEELAEESSESDIDII